MTTDNIFCKYANGKCGNVRTKKRNGDSHTLCAHHQRKACINQRKLDQKRRIESLQEKKISLKAAKNEVHERSATVTHTDLQYSPVPLNAHFKKEPTLFDPDQPIISTSFLDNLKDSIQDLHLSQMEAESLFGGFIQVPQHNCHNFREDEMYLLEYFLLDPPTKEI